MKKNKENRELQSRREFFKDAVKKALPIIGAIALAGSPIFAQAAEKEPMGCLNYCKDCCMSSCRGTCSGDCKGSCQYDCKNGCKTSCRNTCKNGCSRSCTGTSR